MTREQISALTPETPSCGIRIRSARVPTNEGGKGTLRPLRPPLSHTPHTPVNRVSAGSNRVLPLLTAARRPPPALDQLADGPSLLIARGPPA